MKKRCIALYSGGLDSILAVKILMAQSIEVVPIYFTTPFFGFDALRNPEYFQLDHEQKYGISVQVIDFTEDFLPILIEPAHGFGKHLNPCIDCKIAMLRKTMTLLDTVDASFVITGEVIGQRPMSQRRDSMNVIEKQSGLQNILLRPLCAHSMQETLPEKMGVVDRKALMGLSGRGRKTQVTLAQNFGIDKKDIPTPAGGCLLTNEQIALKVKDTIKRVAPNMISKHDVLLDVVGRKFILDRNTVLVVSRNDQENKMLSTMKDPLNVFLRINDIAGPLCVVRGNANMENLHKAAGICLRYTKGKGKSGCLALYGNNFQRMGTCLEAPVFSEEYCRSFQIDLHVKVSV